MNRRSFLKAASLGILAPLALTGRGRSAGTAQRPNILFILTDDQPPHTVAAMEKTLARFAGEGAPGADLTENAWTAVPLCGPARCSLLTGRYQHSHGVLGNDGAFLQYRKKGHPRRDMLRRMKAAGYRLGFFGKYINGYEFNNRYVHPAFGNGDRWVGLADGQGVKNYAVNVDGMLRTEDENHTPYFGRHAEAFMRAGPAPWFCYLNWTDPHLPYKSADISGSYSSPATEEPDLSDKSDYTRSQATHGPDYHRNVYQGQGGEIERLDGWVERLFEMLKRMGQLENTVVLYSSDNGFEYGQHGGLTKKSLPYTESAGTPLLVRGPGFGPHPGGSPLVSHVDLTYTVCAVAGADLSGLEGRDLRGLWRGDPWRERLLVEMISPEPTGERWSLLREGPWCYVDFRGNANDKELYDLDADPYELESVAGKPEHADAESGLAARLAVLKAATGEAVGAAETA